MEPRGSVTFAWDTLGLLLARIPKDRPALSSGLPICEIRGRYRRKQNLFVEGVLPVLLSPTEQDPAAAGCLRTQVSTEIYISGVPGRRTGGTAELPALDGRAPPILSVCPGWMPYSKCTKRSPRLDMTLWQVRDCLITREIKRSGNGAIVGEHVCECGLSVLSSGARCLVLSYQVMRLSSLRACLESGTSSIARLSPAEGCLACPGIGGIFLDPSRHLCSLMRLGLIVAFVVSSLASCKRAIRWSSILVEYSVASSSRPVSLFGKHRLLLSWKDSS